MKALFMSTLMLVSVASFGQATLVDRQEGIIRLTGEAAEVMLETILKAPVKVEADTYVLTMTTRGQNFNSPGEIDIRTYVTGSISCMQDGSSCIVDGSEMRNSRDGWFSPEVGYYRVFGLGKLSSLDTEGYFNCQTVYANIACDFEIKK